MYVHSQLIKAQLENLGSDIASPPTGIVYFNTTSSIPKWYNGSAWKTFLASDFSNVTGVLGAANGGTGVANNAAATTTRSGNFAKTETLTGVTSVTYPTSGTLASLSGTEVLTNKDIDGGTASNTSRITLPKASSATLDGLTDKQATVAYDTTLGTPVYHDGTAFKSFAASGSGELNYIDDASTAANWTETGTRFNGYPVTTIAAGDLPLAGVIDSAIQIVSSTTVAGDETTDYVSYAFTTAASYAVKTKVEFWMRPGSNFVSSEWTVSVFAGATRQSLSTDSSSLTYLPNALGKFTTTFDAVASTAYTLRFTRRVAGAANAATLNIANVIVGPGIQPQGAVVGEWQTYTPTYGGFGTPTGATIQFRRVGSTIEIKGRFVTGTVAAAEASVSLPTGVTLSNTNTTSGFWYRNSSSANVAKQGPLFCSGAIYFCKAEYALTNTAFANLNGNDITGSSELLEFYTGPLNVSQWAGSGTVNLSSNEVQYSSNSDNSNTSSNTTSFAYGPAGSRYPNGAVGTNYNRTVSFTTPIQATDKLEVEISSNTGVSWFPPNSGSGAQMAITQSGTNFGVSVEAGSSTTAVVTFSAGGRISSGATYAANGAPWSDLNNAIYLWRVKKSAGGQAVGFAAATTGSLGLIKLATPFIYDFANVLNPGASDVAFGAGSNQVTNTQVSSSYASSTLTMTFSETGYYQVMLDASTVQAAVYTLARVSTTLGGTATRYASKDAFEWNGEPAADVNFSGAVSFIVNVTTSSQTLTIAPTYRSDGNGNADFTVTALKIQ